MFQTSKDGIADSGSKPRLAMPFKGKAKLTLIENRTINEDKDDKETYENVLAFEFTLSGEDETGKKVTGQIQEKLEWPPRDDDSNEKTQNKIDRIGYIAKYFIGEEAAANLSGNTWEEYVNNVVKTIKESEAYDNKVFNLKVPGQVYQGEPQLQIPNYKGFISDENSASQVSFSKREIQDNSKYIKAMKEGPDSSSDLATTAQEEEDPFSGDSPF